MSRSLLDIQVRPSQWFEYLVGILSEEDVESDLILGALCFTPDFALHVLALANSPTFSAATPIERLDRAVFLLGRKTILDLAFDVPTLRPSAEDELLPMSWDEFVLENIAVSTAASLLARAAQVPLVEEARTAGLIHDLGFDVLAREDRTNVALAWEESLRDGTRLVDHERLYCGTDHCAVGEELFNAAGIPPALVTVAGLHHDPLVATSPYRYLTILVYAAECLVRRTGLKVADVTGTPLEDRVFAELRLEDDVISSFVPLLLSELEKMGLAPRTVSTSRSEP